MSLPLPYYASRLMSLPNAVAGYSNTGLRRLQETSDAGWIFVSYVLRLCGLFAVRCGQSHPQSTDIPDEGSQFARDSDDGDVWGLPSGDELTISPAQPQLRVPGTIDYRFG